LILPDANVLLYAFRSDAQDHNRYRSWLDRVVNGKEAYGVSPQVLASVIRIATHPGIYTQRSTLTETTAFVSSLIEQPHCQLIQPGPNHWPIFLELCRTAKATGNLVQDAWLAALAIESGSELISTDRDFARFPELRWRPPF